MPVRERRAIAALLVLLAVGALVYAGFQARWAGNDRGRAAQFLIAPRCAGSASPAGDCSAWLTRTVSDVRSDKSGLHIDLGGSLEVWYVGASGWVRGLSVGQPVPVLVWEGSAQALRDPEGDVLYSNDSARYQGFSDIGGAVFMAAAALLLVLGALVVSGRGRRSGGYARAVVLIGAVGVAGVVGGAVIQQANSVGRGVEIGVIVFCAVAIAAPVALRRFGGRAGGLPAAGDQAQAGLDRLGS